MSKKSPAWFSAGDFLLLVIAGFWGATYLVVKQLGNAGSIPGLMSLRFLLAATALWAYWLIHRTKFQKREVLIGLGFGLTQTVILNLEAQSVHYTSATNGGLIIALAIIGVPILESAWKRSWLPLKYFIATLIAFIGLVFLIVGNGFVSPNIGDLLMFIAMILRTFHFVVLGRFTQGRATSPANLTTIMVSVSAIAMFLFSPQETFKTAAGYNTNDWLLMLFLSLICTAFAFIGMNWAIKHTSASRASLLLGTEPIWSTILATIVGGELIGPIGIVGALLIVGGTYWGQALEAKHRGGQNQAQPN